MAERLAGELLDAQSEQGGAYQRKEDIYRMARRTKRLRTTAGSAARTASAAYSAA